MEQEILKKWQINVIDFVFSKDELNNFYLTGGTALAGYYLYHRISDDLDFFSFNNFDSMSIHAVAEELRKIIGADKARFSKLYDRNQFYYMVGGEELKIKFTTKLDPITVGSSLAKVKMIKALPKMVKPLTIEELKEFFNLEARKLSPLVIS